MKYEPGELDQLVNIKRQSRMRGSIGGAIVNYDTVESNIFAKITAGSVNEVAQRDVVETEGAYTVVLRKEIDVRNNDVIEWVDLGIEMTVRGPKLLGNRSMYTEYICGAGVAL